MRRRGTKVGLVVFGLLVGSVVIQQVVAYTVATGGTEPCHEGLTGRAYKAVVLALDSPSIELPTDDTWRQMSRFLLEVMEIDPESVDEAKQFMLVSLVSGTRVNDTDGHTLFNLEGLRKVHADPSAEGQYTHCLRGPDDDYAEGDAIAVAGTRLAISAEVNKAMASLQRSPSDQIVEANVYLNFYGDVDLEVWGPAFHIGSAAHIVEDSFAHTIRTEQSDFRKIAHVMNYIDAISTGMDENRDGLAHSDIYDECLNPALKPVVEKADEATKQFFTAVNAQLRGEDPTAVDTFLDEWFTMEPGCTFENQLCDNGHWLELAREKQTGPYMEKIFGCSSVGPQHGGMGAGITLLWLLGGLGIVRILRRKAH